MLCAHHAGTLRSLMHSAQVQPTRGLVNGSQGLLHSLTFDGSRGCCIRLRVAAAAHAADVPRRHPLAARRHRHSAAAAEEEKKKMTERGGGIVRSGGSGAGSSSVEGGGGGGGSAEGGGAERAPQAYIRLYW